LTVKLLLKNLLFTVIVPGSVGVYIPILLGRGIPAKAGAIPVVSWLLFATAAAIYGWSVWQFAAHGRGTPFPMDAPKRLVARGPYQYTRNPMYLALFAALLGWTLLYQTVSLVLYSLAVAAVVNLFVLGYEEPHLGRQFGPEYDEYKAKVPRWVPCLPRQPDA